mmetsp:Transcript_126242/g.365440  ORF Transcript_126242/g.365440 Transcript_126242/m.365440 type:complete len:305 (-) Transcript_126242:291-1205(-)
MRLLLRWSRRLRSGKGTAGDGRGAGRRMSLNQGAGASLIELLDALLAILALLQDDERLGEHLQLIGPSSGALVPILSGLLAPLSKILQVELVVFQGRLFLHQSLPVIGDCLCQCVDVLLQGGDLVAVLLHLVLQGCLHLLTSGLRICKLRFDLALLRREVSLHGLQCLEHAARVESVFWVLRIDTLLQEGLQCNLRLAGGLACQAEGLRKRHAILDLLDRSLLQQGGLRLLQSGDSLAQRVYSLGKIHDLSLKLRGLPLAPRRLFLELLRQLLLLLLAPCQLGGLFALAGCVILDAGCQRVDLV